MSHSDSILEGGGGPFLSFYIVGPGYCHTVTVSWREVVGPFYQYLVRAFSIRARLLSHSDSILEGGGGPFLSFYIVGPGYSHSDSILEGGGGPFLSFYIVGPTHSDSILEGGGGPFLSFY